MELSFYESLSQPQKNYARYIAERAKEMGIPPDLAVAIAFKESSLNPSVQAGAAGEIGIMQIKPDTAKEMGFSLEDIKDPKKNIDAGLAYLKKSLELSEGDPRLAAAGYNAGVNHPFFKSENSLLPSSTVNYLKDLKGFGAFTNIPTPQVVTPAVSEPSEEDLAEEKQIDQAFEDVSRGRGEMIGAAAGAGEAARRAISPATKGVARFLGKAAEEGRLAADIRAGFGPRQIPPEPIGGQMAPDLASQQTAANRILQGTTDVDTGATGRARMGGFNIETAQQAARAKQQAQNIGALQRSGVLTQNAPDVLAKAPGMTASPSGVLYPRTPPVQTGSSAMPTPPSRGALEEVKQVFQKMLGPETRARAAGRAALRYLGPPAAGYQAGSELGSFYHEAGKEKPDYAKMGLSGLGAAGALMSLYPPTMPVGIPLAIGAPLIQHMRENPAKGPLGQMGDVTAP
jgi:hypothetical protein